MSASIAQSSIAPSPTPPSPMILSDRLLSLAQDADRAGCRATAGQLLSLAHTVFDETPAVRQ